MIITTTNDVPGSVIDEVYGEVFGLTVRSRNIGSQIGASFKSLLGGELGGMTKMLAEGREEAIRRLRAKEDLPPEAISDSAGIIRHFIEDYHEKLEENFLFPRFERAGQLVELVKTLRLQHARGRDVTNLTLQLAKTPALREPDDRARLSDLMHQFIRMYSPHEAREDTVLFPAFRRLVSTNEYDSLGEDFEKKEHELFGEDGFESMVEKVAGIEKRLGIYDLAQFTPKI